MGEALADAGPIFKPVRLDPGEHHISEVLESHARGSRGIGAVQNRPTVPIQEVDRIRLPLAPGRPEVALRLETELCIPDSAALVDTTLPLGASLFLLAH